MLLMNFSDKMDLIKQDWAHIFSVKKGKLIRKGNDCFQVNKVLSFIFYFYYYSGIVFFVVLLMFLMQPHFFENVFLKGLETLLLYTAVEALVFFVVPMRKVKCWQTHSV